MSVHKSVDVPRQPAHHTRSHSFASVILGLLAMSAVVSLPVLSISTRAICTPAAATALTAFVV
jgi:hypothetical protein